MLVNDLGSKQRIRQQMPQVRVAYAPARSRRASFHCPEAKATEQTRDVEWEAYGTFDGSTDLQCGTTDWDWDQAVWQGCSL